MNRIPAPPKNSILITMTIIDEHGNETYQQHAVAGIRQMATSKILEHYANEMAKKMDDACIRLGHFDRVMRGENK